MAEVSRWLRRGGRRSVFLALLGLVRLAGFRRAPTLAKALGELEYRLAWRRSRRCAHDMAIVFGRPVGDPRIESQLRRAHQVNAQVLFEILAMLDRRQDDDLLASRIALEGLEHLQASLGAGHGVILLGTHAGNGVLFAVRLAALGWPVTLVYRQSRMASPGLFARGLAPYGVDPILANEGMRAYVRMRDALKRGRIVFVTMDQGVKYDKDGVVVRFLGKSMAMPKGPAQLSRHTQAPVLPVLTTGYDSAWCFRIEAPLAPASGPQGTEVERLARASERQVLLHPELWSWHHRRWCKHPLAHETIADAKEDSIRAIPR
jgi:lauroyl/myristoyl acyltransferase